MSFGPNVPKKPPGAPAVEHLSSDQVIAQLAEHLAPDAMLAFDADGTLWSGDIGVETFHALVAEGGVRGEAAPALREEARSHGVTLTDDPSEQARLLDAARLEGRYPEERAFAMMAWVSAGYTVGELRAFALRVIDEVALASRLHPEVLPILRWASQQNVALYVVSASPAEVIRTALARLDLSVSAVLGMSPEIVEEGSRRVVGSRSPTDRERPPPSEHRRATSDSSGPSGTAPLIFRC